MSTERTFDPKTTYISGGLNDSTGREPFEDPSRDFIPSGTNPAATAGHLHHEHGHHHNEGLNDLSSSTHPTSGNNSGSYNTGSNTGLTGEHSHSSHHTGSNTGLTGDHSHSSHHTGSGLTGAATTLTGDRSHNNYEVAPGSHGGTDLTTHGNVDHLKNNTSGDFKAGTARDPAVGEGRHTGSGLSSAGYVGNQTGDSYGGVQTGNTHYGTGENFADKDRSMTDKIKDKVTGNDNKIHAAPGTEGHGSNIYGSSNAAREYENATDRRTGSGLTGSGLAGSGEAAGYDRSSGGVGNQGVGAFQGSEHGGPISGGAAGTDRFDTSRDHGVTRDSSITGASSTSAGNQYGHDSDNKAANDHKLSGVTRHGDDFTKGDTADSAYHNYQPTGLTGREDTTTGVHDKNLESTGAHKEGLMDKVKNLIGGHSNTTNADHK